MNKRQVGWSLVCWRNSAISSLNYTFWFSFWYLTLIFFLLIATKKYLHVLNKIKKRLDFFDFAPFGTSAFLIIHLPPHIFFFWLLSDSFRIISVLSPYFTNCRLVTNKRETHTRTFFFFHFTDLYVKVLDFYLILFVSNLQYIFDSFFQFVSLFRLPLF